MDIAENENIPGLLMSVDFEKAFDYLQWEFIYDTLKIFNFGNYILNWYTTLYNDIHTCIYNYGYRSDFFPISRGVRQGCPLSPYLFILCAELLSIAIRHDDGIKGIKIGDSEFKLLQYADDTVLCLKWCAETLNNAVQKFKMFENVSGLRMNTEKTTVFRIGSKRDSVEKLCPHVRLKWANHPLNILGVIIPHTDRQRVTEINILPKLETLKTILNIWSSRDLTLFGKNTILKTFGLSQFVYIFTNLPQVIKQSAKKLESVCFNFMWDNKPDKVKRVVMYQDYQMGGMRVKNISLFEKSLKLSWIKKYTDEKNSNWKFLVIHQFKILQKMRNIFFYCNLSQSDFLKYFCEKNANQFWKDTLAIWCEVKFKKPGTKNGILQQYLFLNSYLRVNNKPILYISWLEAGCFKIQHIFKETGQFLSYEEFQTMYNIENVDFLTYYGVVHAIPDEWKNTLRQNNVDSSLTEDYLIEKFKSADKVAKLCYNLFMEKNTFDINILTNKWSADLHTIVNTKEMYRQFELIMLSSISNRIRSFQFTFLHRIIRTNTFAHRIGIINSSECTFCHNHEESIIHLFWECMYTKIFWQRVIIFVKDTFDININLTARNILFSSTDQLMSLCCILGKMYIYNCKIENKSIRFEEYKYLLLSLQATEEEIARRNNKYEQHCNKWKVNNTEE
jgi:hypothetical protein